MIGLLLVNLGSPDAPTPGALKPYLKQFLTDPEVIDIPAIFRWPLVHGLIVPKRARESAKLYRKIWSEDGSPLIHYSRRFADALTDDLSDIEGLEIALGMRYGNPSTRYALEQLDVERLERLIVFPLYPQFARSSTFTAQVQVQNDLHALGLSDLPIQWVQPFYNDPRFIEAIRVSALDRVKAFAPDAVLFSFHGLPERHVKRLHAVCLSRDDCCSKVDETNRNCYRAQCFSTARDVARSLGIPTERYSIAFQSRLGRTPWIRPYTDFVIQELPANGVERLAVFCPSFVADCLETLDEIENREKDRFLNAGGKELLLVPSLNDHPAWVRAAGDIVRDTITIS